ncbi:hypothetical protein PAPHI01_1326 [Pancytospora philotis]|nr:hypothetical protein PAPHI01_1326 [Pancytospora philotis]
MYNYFKYAKQYLRLAGLFCTHKPYEPVDTKAFKAMALEDMIDNTFKLGIQFSSAVTSIQKGYESLRDRDVVMSAEAKFSMLFHCKSLQLFKIILESLFPPIQALMLTTHKIDELARTILDVSSPAAAPSPLNLTFSRAFASRMNLEIAGHLAMLRIAARQFLWESNSEWLAGTTAAIDKANDWKAEKLLAERFLDVPVEQLPSASAMDDDLQDYAPGGLPAKALQCRLNFIE